MYAVISRDQWAGGIPRWKNKWGQKHVFMAESGAGAENTQVMKLDLKCLKMLKTLMSSRFGSPMLLLWLFVSGRFVFLCRLWQSHNFQGFSAAA